MSESTETDDLNEEEEDAEEEEEYEFVATGEKSCERCMALHGSRWDEPPDEPHPHCECEIRVHPKSIHKPRDCDDTTWSIGNIPGGAVTYGPEGDEGFEWGYMVTIDCWDGVVHEFEIWVDMGKLEDWPVTDTLEFELESYAWNEIYDEAEAVVARVCRPCAPQVVS